MVNKNRIVRLFLLLAVFVLMLTGASSYYTDYEVLSLQVVSGDGYKIIFDSNDGVGSMDSLKYTVGDSVNIPECTFEKEGYNFVGWNTNPDGSGDSFSSDEVVSWNIEDFENRRIVLYAQWKELTTELMGGSAFNSLIYRHTNISNIESVEFTDIKAPKGVSGILNVSADNDNGVVAWLNNKVLYISTQRDGYDVRLNKDSSSLFNGFSSLNSISMSKCDTSKAENVSYMFRNCSSLESIDLSNFDTSNVSEMYYMIGGCSLLKEVILGEKFNHVGNQSWLPIPSASDIPGANGKWYSVSTGTAYADYSIPLDTADTYSAIPTGYTIYYNSNGASGTMKPSSYLKDCEGSLSPNEFVYNDSKFSGWNTKPDGTGIPYNDKETFVNLIEAGETITLYAQWEVVYRLNPMFYVNDILVEDVENICTFDILLDGEIDADDVTHYDNYVKEGVTWEIADISLKDNYKYTSFETEGILEYDTFPTARFIQKFTLSYNGVEDSSEEVWFGEYFTTKEALSRTGYSQVGWNTSEDGSGHSYGMGAYVSFRHLNDIVLFPEWQADRYLISYNLNGGTNPSGAVTYYTIEDEITLPIPERSGYTFDGWYVYTYVEVPYYHCNGCDYKSLSVSDVENHLIEQFFMGVDECGGWHIEYEKQISSSVKVESIPKGSIGDIALEAQWSD